MDGVVTGACGGRTQERNHQQKHDCLQSGYPVAKGSGDVTRHRVQEAEQPQVTRMAHPPFSQYCHRSSLDTRSESLRYSPSLPSRPRCGNPTAWVMGMVLDI